MWVIEGCRGDAGWCASVRHMLSARLPRLLHTLFFNPDSDHSSRYNAQYKAGVDGQESLVVAELM